MKTNGGFLISQIKAIQARVFEKLLINSGVEEFNGAQGRILYVLWQEDHLPIVEVAKRTGLAKTTLTSMLDRLETKGLIAREYAKADRRQIFIVLTENAQSLQSKYIEVSDQMNNIFYKGLSENDVIEFENKLQKVLQNLIVAEQDNKSEGSKSDK